MAKRRKKTKRLPSGANHKHVWQAAFLEALRKCARPMWAAEAAKVSPQRAYLCRQEDAEFRAKWEEALTLALDDLEAEAHKRAKDGSDQLLMFLLKSKRPRRFDRSKTQEVDVNVGGQEDNPVRVVTVIRETLVNTPAEAKAWRARQTALNGSNGKNGHHNGSG